MELADKTVLVTGGAGLIGSTIIDQLLVRYRPRKVIVLDNMVRGTLLNLEQAMASGRLEVVQKDIRDSRAIRPHFDGVDAVFHQAAVRITLCAQKPRECLDVLINGTFNVLEACVNAGVKKVVAASSASVYGLASVFPTPEEHHPYHNRTWYGAAKTCTEGMLRSFRDMFGLDYVALRYFNVYGPRMDIFGKYTEVLIRWLDCIERDEPPKICGDGTQTMDFVFSEDVARANLLAMQRPVTDEVFNVASGREVRLLDLLQLLLQLTRSDHLQPEFVPERSVNPVPRRLADTTKAERQLGFRAAVPLEEGLARLLAWREDVISRRHRAAYEQTELLRPGIG